MQQFTSVKCSLHKRGAVRKHYRMHSGFQTFRLSDALGNILMIMIINGHKSTFVCLHSHA